MKPKTVIFIHGMHMTPLCWEKWLPTFEARGFETLAPAWPGSDRPVQGLRQRHPDPDRIQVDR